MNWEQEKVYCKKRAKEPKTEMEAATAASNEERFIKAYQTAMRYMTKKELKPLYMAFIESMSETSLKPVIEKLENLFSKFNEKFYNGELQTPIITVSPDTTKGAYGWCTAWKAWSNKQPEQKKTADLAAMSKEDLENLKKDEGFYEINICAEHLARPFEQVAETLLHEMVHLYNLQIGVQDTSRGGTYHNKKYKEAAEQHGLTVDKDAKYGWTVTTLNDEAKAFVSSFQDKKFELHRKSFPKIPGAAKTKQSTRKYVCPMCGTIIRATKEVHVVCGDCEVEFEEES